MGGELQGSGFSDQNQAVAERHYAALLGLLAHMSIEGLVKSGPGTAADHAARIMMVARGMDLFSAQKFDAREIEEHFSGHKAQFGAGA